MKRHQNLKWVDVYPGQPLAARLGDVTLWKFPDGHVTVTWVGPEIDWDDDCDGYRGGTFIDAQFSSVEAALSWDDGIWEAAEHEWRRINPETPRTKLLDVRRE